ncbi:MAG: hypothetical protein HQL16_08015 [Candidatus Omnitrophica bacterium]|nr:hypothetical protein [Candidatus Omnitrophota bacterium]
MNFSFHPAYYATKILMEKRKNSFFSMGRCDTILPMDQIFLETISGITTRDQRYKPEAYEFIVEALSFTQKKFRRERHVSGEELVAGVIEFAVRKFGALAFTVFSRWGILATEDVGAIVFNLVNNGILTKQEEDTFESFRGGSFEESLRQCYLRQLEQSIKKIR